MPPAAGRNAPPPSPVIAMDMSWGFFTPSNVFTSLSMGEWHLCTKVTEDTVMGGLLQLHLTTSRLTCVELEENAALRTWIALECSAARRLVPFTLTITSPFCNPANAAGWPNVTAETGKPPSAYVLLCAKEVGQKREIKTKHPIPEIGNQIPLEVRSPG